MYLTALNLVLLFGLKKLVNICESIPKNDINLHHSFLLLVKYSILPNKMVIYEKCINMKKKLFFEYIFYKNFYVIIFFKKY